MMLQLFNNISSMITAKDSPLPSMQIVSHLIIDRRNQTPNNNSKTIVLAHKDAHLYLAIKTGILTKSTIETTDPSEWTDPTTCLPPQKLILANSYLAYEPNFTKYTPPDTMAPDNIYVKHVNLLDAVYSHGIQGITTPLVSQITARELSVCELLRQNPHRNIAEYKGVSTGQQLSCEFRGHAIHVPMDTERVLGLVFKRYDCTLWDVVHRRLEIDVEACLKGVALGIRHVHRLGLVHGDVRPENIFVRLFEPGGRDTYVLGDFDSAQLTGSLARLKGGGRRWGRKKVLGRDFVEVDDDWYGFEMVKRWLCGELGEEIERYGEVGSWRG